jgi:tyrosyl-tRNA synthetase
VPMRQMLGREFVQSRLGEDGAGISYAEFSYALIQGYDFLHLHRTKGASLQVAGADQWGNSIAGVELIRRITGDEADVWTGPLVVNKTTGVKFGKTEGGAIWLDPKKTTPTQFYQFWINCDDAGVEDYLKVYTLLSKEDIEETMAVHRQKPADRVAQNRLANEVTQLVHGKEKLFLAQDVTAHLMGVDIVHADAATLEGLRSEIPAVHAAPEGSIVEALVASKLASSNTEARRFLKENAISVNGQKVSRENFEADDFHAGRLLIRRGKAYKDSALVELQG